jgi:Helicase HerA, central domain
MSGPSFSTAHIEYLEKRFLDQLNGKIDLGRLKTLGLGTSSLLKIRGMSNFWEMRDEKIVSLRLFMEDIISGLHEAGIPLIFAIFGGVEKVDIVMGTVAPTTQDADNGLRIIKTSLQGSFQGIELEEQSQDYLKNNFQNFAFSGLVTGISTEKVGTENVGVEQIERLIRGLYGKEYGYLVLATPAPKNEINNSYNSVLNELRMVIEDRARVEKSAGLESPLAKRYRELLEAYLDKLQLAKNQGMWHTQIFILSKDPETMRHLKAVVKSVFGGKESLPESIRTFDIDGKINDPTFIADPAPLSPGQFFYPYSFVTTLNSTDLGNFVNLPTQEMPGFQISPYARFHVSKADKEESVLSVGEIMDQGAKTGNFYKVSLNSLRKHGLIVGTTGSGKTNTLFYLLKEAWRHKIPFLVLEPAKTEYRSLLYSEEMGKDINVFTLGDNNVSPFRMNPFEIMPGVAVQTHVDLLKSVFNASFYMWGPLPQVLERCIHEVYTDKGWDLTSNENHRGVHRDANPTLTDLYNKIDAVAGRLGYSSETTMEIRSALKTRINSMRIGAKGLMLDTRNSTPFSTLISKPTILELEAVGDDEEKAFMMGVILTMMYEHYVSHGLSEVNDLKHLTVIEEAHRLLGNYAQENPYVGNTRGKAVETFSNILSEIRAYGEGFLIAEQIPMKLALDVIKNTNLKVMHRVVAEDDRKVMGATMNIEERETKKITSMSVGEAAVYGEGDEGAYHIRVPYSKIESRKGEKEKEEEAIRKAMKSFTDDARNYAPFEGCLSFCKSICKFKTAGSEISSTYRFFSQMPKLAVALLDKSTAVKSILLQMLEVGGDEGRKVGDVRGVKVCTAIQGAERYFETLGKDYSWSYDGVEQAKAAFIEIYMDALDKFTTSETEFLADTPANRMFDQQKIAKFNDAYTNLCKDKQPTRICSKICEDSLCLYRFNLKEPLYDQLINKRFFDIIQTASDDMWEQLYDLCRAITEKTVLLGGSEDTARKIALCFALQKSNSFRGFSRRHVSEVMLNLIDWSNPSARKKNGSR